MKGTTKAMQAVPFTLDNVWAGFGRAEGLLREDGTHLCFEYQLKDAVLGAFKGDVKELRIPLQDVVSVTLTKGWLGKSWMGVKIVIQTARLEVLKDMPGASHGRVELIVSRKDHALAEKFVADLHENDEHTE